MLLCRVVGYRPMLYATKKVSPEAAARWVGNRRARLFTGCLPAPQWTFPAARLRPR